MLPALDGTVEVFVPSDVTLQNRRTNAKSSTIWRITKLYMTENERLVQISDK